jgi:hypothetical protein
LDEVDVVRLQISQDDRHGPEPGQTQGHPPHDRRFPQAGEAEDEHRRVEDELAAFEPGQRVAAQGGVGEHVPAQQDADHR